MPWNTPGSSDPDNNRSSRSRRNRSGGSGGGGFRPEDYLDSLRGLFGGNGAWRWLVAALLLFVVFNSFVLVTEQQRGVVLRFGQFSRVLQPGPHLKLPWPAERVIKVAATRIDTYTETVPILTRDENIVTVEINVQYRVGDPKLYLFGTRDANQVLQQAALSSVREQVGRSDLDTVLGARDALAVSAKTNLQASLDAYRTGLFVTELNLPNARPPEEVKPAFDDVNSAQQDKDRLISEAQAYAAKIVPEARGNAARTRTVAEGYKTATVARASGDAQRFSLLVDEYKKAPDVTRKRLWLDTVQQVLQDNRKVVGGDGRQLIYVPMAGGGAAPVADQPAIVPPEVVSPTVTVESRGVRPERGERPDTRKEPSP